MAYTEINFKTKKALKEAVKIFNEFNDSNVDATNFAVRCYQKGVKIDPKTGIITHITTNSLDNYTGTVYLEGPHYPEAHTWYCEAELKDGVIIKVK